MNTHASVSEKGKINHLVIEGPYVSFWLNGTDDTSECSGGERWVLQESDSLFEVKYHALLKSYEMGKNVEVRSTGTCGNWDGNRVDYLKLSK